MFATALSSQGIDKAAVIQDHAAEGYAWPNLLYGISQYTIHIALLLVGARLQSGERVRATCTFAALKTRPHSRLATLFTFFLQLLTKHAT